MHFPCSVIDHLLPRDRPPLLLCIPSSAYSHVGIWYWLAARNERRVDVRHARTRPRTNLAGGEEWKASLESSKRSILSAESRWARGRRRRRANFFGVPYDLKKGVNLLASLERFAALGRNRVDVRHARTRPRTNYAALWQEPDGMLPMTDSTWGKPENWIG